MTTDEYLKTCANVPSLPSGLRWWVSTWKEDREFTKANGEVYSRNYTYVLIEILDINVSRNVKGSYRYATPTELLTSHPQIVNHELPGAARKAYNNLYKTEVIDFDTLTRLDNN